MSNSDYTPWCELTPTLRIGNLLRLKAESVKAGLGWLAPGRRPWSCAAIVGGACDIVTQDEIHGFQENRIG
jgi:hypothetical protein